MTKKLFELCILQELQNSAHSKKLTSALMCGNLETEALQKASTAR